MNYCAMLRVGSSLPTARRYDGSTGTERNQVRVPGVINVRVRSELTTTASR
jgi:hypothetical protein